MAVLCCVVFGASVLDTKRSKPISRACYSSPIAELKEPYRNPPLTQSFRELDRLVFGTRPVTCSLRFQSLLASICVAVDG